MPNLFFSDGRGTMDQILLFAVIKEIMGVYLSCLQVLCGSGEGL